MDEKIFEVKDHVVADGITSDYVWYNSKLLRQRMSSWETDFEKIVKVMEDRHKEHLDIIDNLLQQARNLQYVINGLTEKLSGETKWVGLNEEEIGIIYRDGFKHGTDFARAVEAKLKEKNGG